MSELEQIEARLKAATPGPWVFDGDEIDNVPDYESDNPEPWTPVMECEVSCGSYCYGGSVNMTIKSENRALIESAPADIAYLLTLARKQAAALEAVNVWVGRHKTGFYDEAQDDVFAMIRTALEDPS